MFKLKKCNIGPLLWILSAQYFFVQLFAMHSFLGGFSIRYNTISDLGNTVCGPFGGRHVCSPYHNAMNISFVVLGLCQLVGARYIYKLLASGRLNAVSFGALGISGIGTILVGLFPENTIGLIHGIGAGLPFFVGNVAIILLGFSLKVPKLLKVYTLFTGLIAVVALILFVTQTYFGIGIGGLERLVAYPQTVWLIVVGAYSLWLKYAHDQPAL